MSRTSWGEPKQSKQRTASRVEQGWKDRKQWGKRIITPRWWQPTHLWLQISIYRRAISSAMYDEQRSNGRTTQNDLLIGISELGLLSPMLALRYTGLTIYVWLKADGKQLSEDPPLDPPHLAAANTAASHDKRPSSWDAETRLELPQTGRNRDHRKSVYKSVRMCALIDWLIPSHNSEGNQVTHLLLLLCEAQMFP